MITLLDTGIYKLVETKNHAKILTLGSKRMPGKGISCSLVCLTQKNDAAGLSLPRRLLRTTHATVPIQGFRGLSFHHMSTPGVILPNEQ